MFGVRGGTCACLGVYDKSTGAVARGAATHESFTLRLQCFFSFLSDIPVWSRYQLHSCDFMTLFSNRFYLSAVLCAQKVSDVLERFHFMADLRKISRIVREIRKSSDNDSEE